MLLLLLTSSASTYLQHSPNHVKRLFRALYFFVSSPVDSSFVFFSREGFIYDAEMSRPSEAGWLAGKQTGSRSRSIAPFHSALKAAERKIGLGVGVRSAVGSEGRMGQLSVEKANTMTDNVAAAAAGRQQSSRNGGRARLMHLKRNFWAFWPFALHPPSLGLRASSVVLRTRESGGEITSILCSLCCWSGALVPPGSVTRDDFATNIQIYFTQ